MDIENRQQRTTGVGCAREIRLTPAAVGRLGAEAIVSGGIPYRS